MTLCASLFSSGFGVNVGENNYIFLAERGDGVYLYVTLNSSIITLQKHASSLMKKTLPEGVVA